jgi:tRNA-2-methylthio-N6-dimethylallyladenosine synthase
MPTRPNKVYIKTFGCVQNTADSERIKAFFWEQNYVNCDDWKKASLVVINTCIIRESAENRAYGLIDKVNKWNRSLGFARDDKIKIIVTGCLSGLASRDKTGKKLKQLKRDFPAVNEFWPIEKFSEDLKPARNNRSAALIPISTGCNNYCSYCIVPMARGKEVSRKQETILSEVDQAITAGFKEIILIGQNVNSYGASFDNAQDSMVSMGKKRFKSMFPRLLETVAQKKLQKVSFVSSNPWDFSDELIEVIAKYPNIDRLLHLPFQSGDDVILKKMNRGYTKKEYLDLIKKIKKYIPDVRLSTDIIVGFPGEDEVAFQNTVDLCKKVGFEIAYINKYSPRRGTVSANTLVNDVPQSEKKRRWNVLNELVNKKLF